jgi:hypothetical protein
MPAALDALVSIQYQHLRAQNIISIKNQSFFRPGTTKKHQLKICFSAQAENKDVEIEF